MSSAERKVLFFKLRVRDDDIENQMRTFEQSCEKIMQLSVGERSHTIASSGPEEYIRLMSFQKTGDFYGGHFAKYRSGNIVTGKDDNDKAEDYTLEDGRKPLEITHFIYIPRYHLLAVEYNHHGPKYSQFVIYINVLQLKARLDGIYYVADTVFHPDTLEVLRSAQKVKMVELTTSRVNIPNGRGFQKLRATFETLANIGKPGKISIVLRAERGRDVMTGMELANFITDDDDQQANLDSAKAKVVIEEGMDAQIINLLQNKIDSSIRIPSDVAAGAQEIFDEIWKVYLNNKKLLLRAIDEKND